MSQNTPKPRMATNIPSQKLQASGGASAITILIVWGLRQWAGVEMPPEAAMALITVISLLTQYITPPASRDRIIT